MASMTRLERAQHYAQRIIKAYNKRSEADDIATDLNSLVYTSNNEKLSKSEKLEIITEVENQLRIIKRKQESNFSESVNLEKIDNGDILDVIGDMKKKVKD